MHYRTSRPLKLTEPDFAKNWAAAVKHFSENHKRNARQEALRIKELEQEKENQMAVLAEVQESNICFTLKTEAGALSYSQNESATYTDFVRASIDLLLAFNGSDIDPNFKKVMQHAMEAYVNGDADFFDFNSDDDNDYIERALKAQQEQLEEAKKYVATLPQSEFLTLRILSCDTNDHRIENQFTRHTDFPPNVVYGIIHNHDSFELPFEKATKLYIDLRMLETILSVRVPVKSDKTTVIRKSAHRQSNKNNKSSELTGKELLKPEDGVVI